MPNIKQVKLVFGVFSFILETKNFKKIRNFPAKKIDI